MMKQMGSMARADGCRACRGCRACDQGSCDAWSLSRRYSDHRREPEVGREARLHVVFSISPMTCRAHPDSSGACDTMAGST